VHITDYVLFPYASKQGGIHYEGLEDCEWHGTSQSPGSMTDILPSKTVSTASSMQTGKVWFGLQVSSLL
jgi:hypothetical protein